MGILSGIGSWIAKTLMEMVFSRLIAWGKALFAKFQGRKEDHEKNAANSAQDTKKLEQLTPESSVKEQEHAIDDALSRF